MSSFRSAASARHRAAGQCGRRYTALVGFSSVAAATLVAVSVSVVVSQHASATPTSGTGGLFTATPGRIVDTQTGLGGYSTPNNGSRAYTVDGLAGVPASGVSAVSISIVAHSPSAGGYALVGADPTPGTASVLNFLAGQTISNTVLAPVGSDGKIIITTSVSTNLLVDVEGYFKVGGGGLAPGGYAPVSPFRMVDTRNGTGAPMAKVPSGGSISVATSGVGGIPAAVSGIFLSITPVNQSAGGYLVAYPTGTTMPNTSLNWPDTNAALRLTTDGARQRWCSERARGCRTSRGGLAGAGFIGADLGDVGTPQLKSRGAVSSLPGATVTRWPRAGG